METGLGETEPGIWLGIVVETELDTDRYKARNRELEGLKLPNDRKID